MGAFKSNTSRLLCFYLVAACFLCILPYTGYQVFAEENDADLVFENNLEETKLVSDDNKHTIERRDVSHQTSHLNSKSSQPAEEEHWLTSTVKRLKRQWNFGKWFGGDDEDQDDSDEDEQGQTDDDEYDNENDIDDNNNEVDEIIPESRKHPSLESQRPHHTDDEDDFGDLSGSGSTDIPSTHPIVPGQPVYYRILMTVIEPYVEQYSDRNSAEYKELSGNLVNAVDNLYESLEGRQSATVIRIQKREADIFSSKVTMDLGTIDYYDHARIRNHLYSHIHNYHTLGTHQVSTEDFSFREFEGGKTLPVCQPDQLPCHSGECVPASARCNGRYECQDESDEAGCDYNINEVDLRGNVPSYTTDSHNGPHYVETTPHSDVLTSIFNNIFQHTAGLDQDQTTTSRSWHIPHPTEDSRYEHPYTPEPPFRTDYPHSPETTTQNLFVTMFNELYNRTSGLGDHTNEVDVTTRPWYIPETRPTDIYRSGQGYPESPTTSRDWKFIRGTEPSVDVTTTQHPLVSVFNALFNATSDLTTEIDGESATKPSVQPSSRCRADDVFRCPDGSAVICADQLCDGVWNCPRGEDERDCNFGCATGELSCDLKRCIPLSKRCDGFHDCDDGTDELECEPQHCKPGQFRCHDGYCIEDYQECDHHPDCRNGEDERDCPEPACQASEFQCNDKSRCIDKEFLCDGYEDCDDASDEKDCGSAHDCRQGEFSCGDGNCIPVSQKCDGSNDCVNGLDEFDCPQKACRTHEFTCNDGGCIPTYYVCDGISQCNDGSDEAKCGCRADEFQCRNGKCIPKYQQCNRNYDCSDGSDEINCPTQPPTEPEPTPPTRPPSINCPWGQKPCNSGNQCLPYASFCDGHFDCNDFSDEANCPGSGGGLDLKTYPSQQTIKERREVVFQCRDEGPLRAKVQWVRGNGLPLPPGSRDVNGRLEIPHIQIEHSGSYTCIAVGYPPSTPGSQVHVYLTVETYTPPPTRPPTACDLHEATCSNGDCIAKHLVCDGNYDCSDGSDETRCSPHGCEPNEFRCANKRCVLKTWRCDGDDDCGDGTDEINCATNPPGSPCKYSEFACHSGNQCIPKSFHCDHERDCVDGSDEVGCSAVVISKPPPPMAELNIGDLFVITCTAVAVPTPEIVWRLNWGHIPEKCTTTSVNGVGTLTCPNIQVEDQGAYSCEAINILGSIIAIPDTILVVHGGKTLCPKGTFNEEAKSVDECITCFCFGAATDCKSADLFTYQLQPPFDSHKTVGVHIDPYSGVTSVKEGQPIYRGSQPRVTPVGRNGVRVQLQSPYADLAQPDVLPYFTLPENFYGNQLKSYGGYLKYKLHYEGYGRPTNAPDLILSGNGYTLLHTGKPHQAGREEQISVRFFIGDWVKRTETGPERLATREEIMMVLEHVQSIQIKLQYIEGQLDTSLTNIEMDSAAIRNTGLGQAIYVEECKCPVGYTGLSCESCDSGYSRHRSGPWLGQCYKVQEPCQPGTYGDPGRGIPCQVCPCPLTNPSNQFARTCQLGPDGEVICDCPSGYTGKRCQQCAAGYTGNPLVPGDSCKPGGICNPAGSISSSVDESGRCVCKQNTDGPTCNQCKPNTFHLNGDNQFGCITCFCMGITQQCSSSNLYRDTLSTVFTSSRSGFGLVESLKKESPIHDGIRLDQNAREIVYSDFSNRNQDVYYWSLPSRYLGDKLTSYGGYLRYSLRYVPLPGGQSSRNTAPDVELISDNHINLLYFAREYPQANSNQSFSVSLLEQNWQRADGQQADREHLLMALADLKAILIKATYTTGTREAALMSVSLDIANERNTGREHAVSVEQCQCPAGYKGLSCEDCDVGYTRASEGLYLGLCEPCSCNGHSNECDPESGDCLNCRDFTTGPNCELCLPGYEPDVITGECRGHSIVCECDPAGSVSSICLGGVCQCKTNVEGPRCDRCRQGTYGLNLTNSEGCQECFCSGITDQCSESSLYIEQIPSQILYQDNHGYTLTTRNLNERISDDFILNMANNRIGYSFTSESSQTWYWTLPIEFTGNKIKSYGGRLEFTQHISSNDYGSLLQDQDIVIMGNSITMYWINTHTISLNRDNKISVQLSTSDNWQRIDYRQGPRPASREDIMIILANIDTILVRATYTSGGTSFISDITMDTAVDQYTGQPRARDVEVCRCPVGYGGTSCESCDVGYYKDRNDLQAGPLGSCTKCPCNENEKSCSLGPDNRVICNCLPGYDGRYCDGEVTTTSPPIVTDRPIPPPIITVEIEGPTIRIVEVGQSVRLTCSASSSSPNLPIRVQWLKEGGYLSPDHAIDDGRGILVITDVRVSDAGTYICQATDGYVIVTKYTTINVGGGNPPVAPTVSISPSTIEVSEGNTLEMYCSAVGNPTPTLQWIRTTGEPLNPTHSFTNGVFHISHVEKSDEGQYACIASNNAGIQRSVAYLRVIQIPTSVVIVTITPSHYYGNAGETFSLTCDAPRPWISLVWSRANRLPLPYSAVRSDDDRVLTIYNARPEDSGTYVCTVTTTVSRGNGTSYVSISTEQIGEQPKVTIDPAHKTVSQGETVEIRCDATGVPPPTIKWTKANEPFNPNIQQIGPILRIQNIQMRDRGVYVCVASNKHGLTQGSSIIEVERREAPVIEIHPSKALTITAGNSIVVQCRVTAGVPQPSVHWSRSDGRPLSSSIEQLSNGVLRFTSITIAESGEYMCAAENIAGKTTAVAHVEVHTIPVLTIRPRGGIITVNEGEYIRLECTAAGVPQPTVQWSKHSANYGGLERAFAGPPSILTTELQNVAVYEITRVTVADQGYYICQGQNSAGAVEERVSLIVDSVPQRGDITGQDGSSGHHNDVTYPPYIPPRPPGFRDNEHTPARADKTFTAPVGTRAELRCQIKMPDGLESLYVNWIRGDNSSLPENSQISDGILYIDNVQPSDAGEYRCIGLHSSGTIVFSFSAHLVVVSPPRITLVPPRQVVRPGDNAHIECAATGEQPITITWSPLGRSMPDTAYAQEGHLQFHGIQVADAGRYRCTAVNTAGQADAVAEVVVQDHHQETTITAENREQVAVIGTSLTLHCVVRGGNEQPAPKVHWFREHLPLPTNAHISGEYLQIVDIQPNDAGKYLCEVASNGGTSSDYINVRVEHHGSHEWSPPKSDFPELDIQASDPNCHVGDTVDLYCRSSEPGVITSWSKVSGRFANNIQTSGGTLRFSNARRENSGLYRCEARGHQGVYHKDYNFEVIDSNIENVQDEQPIETVTAAQGSTVVMECRTDLQQPISYQWSKPGGVLPRDVDIHSRTIRLNEVRGSDAGIYICSANNDGSSIDTPTVLVVTGIVPYFAQAPTSYISLPTLPEAYVQFNFEISFKPETQDGLLLYNGHRKSMAKSDFISLALVNGIPEFRFNLGQGATLIRGDRPVSIGNWHTIKVSRNRKRGTMYVDGQGPFIGTAEGKFVGLDLTDPLYLGGVPNFKEIAPEIETDSGFVGCISRFKIGHLYQDILHEAMVKEGITTCETCSENPCHNQGVCQEALTMEGYTCICPVGFGGPTCTKRGGEACTPYACGPGRCIDTDENFKCLCPLGRAGRHCEKEIAIYEPGFVNDAYIAYPTPKAQRRLKVSLKFKPKDLSDGILLYCAESPEGHGDFASLAIRDRHLEFRFDIGSDPVVIRSDKELQPGEWLAVTASKFLNEGRLLINGDAPVIQRVAGNHKTLNLHTPLYVGGIDKQRMQVNRGVGVDGGFNGCISEINVSGLNLNVIQSVTDSANVEDCTNIDSGDLNESSNEIAPHYDHNTQPPYDGRSTGCLNNPCRNDGQCYPLSSSDYMCNCAHGYTGHDCEIAPNLCEHLQPCQNGGNCNGTTIMYTCSCPMGFTGTNCEQRAELRNEVNFNGNGYIELSRSLLNHEHDDENEVIAFELSTNSSNGLIFWHGQRPNDDGQGQDYIALAVVDGYLEYSFELGSGPAIIYNNEVRINDGERHRVILKRRGRWGSIEVDNDHIIQGNADGPVNQMNCYGNIYLGGTPNNILMTANKYLYGFNGCIYGFEVQDSKMLDIGAKALSGVNVKPCSSPNDVASVFDNPDEDFIY